MQAIIILFILLFTLEAARGLTFTTNRLRLAGKEQYSWQKEHAFELYADSILKNKIKITGINKAVVAGSWYYMNHRVSIYSHLPILQDAGKLNDYINLHAKEPVLLLVIIDKKDTAAFQPFIHSENQIAGEFDGYYFYTLYVSPN